MLYRALRLLLGPSARDFLDEGRKIPGYGLGDFLHGYIYGRWPYFYIGAATGGLRLSKLVSRAGNALLAHSRSGSGSFADSYHGKVLTTESAKKLIRIGRDIVVDDLEQVIPYATARSLILKHPEHITVLDCPCRSSRETPCLPLGVCLIVGEPFASFIAEHHPARSRRIDVAEACRILEDERGRGHVHHAFFKDAMLGRFYAVCNCCSCCCGAMQAMRHGVPMLASSGFVAESDPERCRGCGLCVKRCPFGAMAVEGPFEKRRLRIDRQACMGCGVCVEACAKKALRLTPAPDRGLPLDPDALPETQTPPERRTGATSGR